MTVVFTVHESSRLLAYVWMEPNELTPACFSNVTLFIRTESLIVCYVIGYFYLNMQTKEIRGRRWNWDEKKEAFQD